jgi:drug/metabolite transporter (DMT)-like permease
MLPGSKATDLPDPRQPWSQGTKIIAAFAVIYLVWGSTFLATRIGVLEMPPLLFAAGRFTIAGTLLAGAALVLRESFPRTRREWLHAGLFSILMVPMSNGLSTVAVRHVPSNEAACSPRALRSGLRASARSGRAVTS